MSPQEQILAGWTKDEATGDYYGNEEWGDSILGNWSGQASWYRGKDGRIWMDSYEIERALEDADSGFGQRWGNYYPFD